MYMTFREFTIRAITFEYKVCKKEQNMLQMRRLKVEWSENGWLRLIIISVMHDEHFYGNKKERFVKWTKDFTFIAGFVNE